jgi:hypothetical protein
MITHLNTPSSNNNVQTTLRWPEEENHPATKKENRRRTEMTPEDKMRILFKNVNGIGGASSSKEWENITKELAIKKIAVCGLAETNFAWNPARTREMIVRAKVAMQQATGKRTNLFLQTSSCTGWIGGRYQPGGTCTMALDKWASRVISKDEDPQKLGRWSTIKIRLRGTEIAFITVYRVCKTQVNLDTNTSYSQQWKELASRADPNPDPRKSTLQDLKKYVKKKSTRKKVR